MPSIKITRTYVTFGRRQRIHSRDEDRFGVSKVGTERCNRDDSKFPLRELTPAEVAAAPQGQFCGWCFRDEDRDPRTS